MLVGLILKLITGFSPLPRCRGNSTHRVPIEWDGFDSNHFKSKLALCGLLRSKKTDAPLTLLLELQTGRQASTLRL